MHYDEHDPPHFHALYGDNHAVIELDTLAVRRGRLPRRALAIVLEWAVEHREELRENWRRVEVGEQLLKIRPLR